MKIKIPVLIALNLTILTSFSAFLLTSSVIFADDSVIDEVNITVPVSCSLNGTGMDSHNATVNNGTYASNIGTTTLKAFCNDNEGFAIYAIGYTDDTDGKNVLTNAALDSSADIITGTATTGNSQWAMKLATDSNATYPISIENNYNNYHTVPDDYELVAKRTSATDIGASAIGSTLTSTYQVFISNTQPAGTYMGKVKYVMVHPNTAPEPIRDDQIEVIFDGNGLTFANGSSKNRMVYTNTCSSGYVGNNYQEIMTHNISTGGEASGAYTENESILQPVTINGADRLKVVVKYGFSDAFGAIIKGEWNGPDEPENYQLLYNYEENEETFIFEGDTITVHFESYSIPDGPDYGLYVKVYPIYDTEQPDTSYEDFPNTCSLSLVYGNYTETTTWYGNWYTIIDDYYEYFYDENDIKAYIEENKESLLGKTIILYASHPYTISYDGNSATAGTMEGFTTTIWNPDDAMITLLAPNYYKYGYGFAGWSTNQDATVNSNSKIFGPSEIITFDELFSNSNAYDVTLYAVWVPANGTMQSFNCSSLSPGKVTALSDERDENVYTVGKMQDGECWMMENLRLDAENSLDSTKAQGFGGNFVGLANSEEGTFFYSNTSANSLYNISNITGDNQSYRFPRYNNNMIRIGGTDASGSPLTVDPTYKDENNQVQWYGYGNYYSWAAAAASTIDYVARTDVTTSICPLGWHLPTTTESDALLESFGGDGSQVSTDGNIAKQYSSYPNNFIRSGYYIRKPQQYGDDLGEYWLATSVSSQAAAKLYLQGTDIINKYGGVYVDSSSEASWNYKNQGEPIRCIAD